MPRRICIHRGLHRHLNLQPCKIQAKKYLFRQHTKGGLQKEHNTEERIGGNRPDTRPTSANKNEFSATVSMYVVRRRLLHQNLNPFQGSFRLLCANFFVRGNHLYYFSYMATFGLLFQKLPWVPSVCVCVWSAVGNIASPWGRSCA